MNTRCLILLALLSSANTNLLAQEKTPKEPQKVELSAAEKAFAEQLTKATLVGRFSVESRPDRNPQPERYTIESVRKTGKDNWIVQARITYGKYDLPVPVPVQVYWAGDTPMLHVTNLKIPLMGEGFTARVMFYKNRYAGSWYHGKVGGHMWGDIEHEAAKGDAQAKPTSSDQ